MSKKVEYGGSSARSGKVIEERKSSLKADPKLVKNILEKINRAYSIDPGFYNPKPKKEVKKESPKSKAEEKKEKPN